MSDGEGPRGPRRETEVREHLANERTVLSWVRTGVALISIGLVVERAGALAGGAGSAGASDAFGWSSAFGESHARHRDGARIPACGARSHRAIFTPSGAGST